MTKVTAWGIVNSNKTPTLPGAVCNRTGSQQGLQQEWSGVMGHSVLIILLKASVCLRAALIQRFKDNRRASWYFAQKERQRRDPGVKAGGNSMWEWGYELSWSVNSCRANMVV